MYLRCRSVAAVWALLWAGLASSTTAQAAVGSRGAAVYTSSDGTLNLREGAPGPGAVAWATFEDTGNKTGWGVLDVRTSGSDPVVDDETQLRAAGLAEGYLTAHQVALLHRNFAGGLLPNGTMPASLRSFLAEQLQWAKGQSQGRSEPFWRHVSAVLAQLEGLQAGYSLAALDQGLPALDVVDFSFLSGAGDSADILAAVDAERRAALEMMTIPEQSWRVKSKGMCSALVKVPEDLSDLLMGHSTWILYAFGNRIFKNYHFDFQAPAAAKRFSFSSYPGVLVSIDDFYMMDSGLGMVQTSNAVLDPSLYDLVTSASLLAWQRVRVAHALAHDGEEWYRHFATHASGTYNNQYMVVNYNLFTPGQPLQNGTLWVVEEIPGLVAGADQTESLRAGYWGSYNVPFYPEIRARSGYEAQGLGAAVSHERAPRARIFRRDQASVRDLAGLKRILRYANYSDPLAIDASGQVDYSAAICMRGDLMKAGAGAPSGCTDTKVTSYRHGFWKRTADVANGPTSTASDGTHGLSGNAPFAWRPAADAAVSHVGDPLVYDFDFTTVVPKDLACSECSGEPVEGVPVRPERLYRILQGASVLLLLGLLACRFGEGSKMEGGDEPLLEDEEESDLEGADKQWSTAGPIRLWL